MMAILISQLNRHVAVFNHSFLSCSVPQQLWRYSSIQS